MRISNWNGRPFVQNPSLKKASLFNELNELGAFCIRGNGRSYGDSSLQNVMLEGRTIPSFMDLKDDILTVSAGYTLGEVLDYLIRKGFKLPVIPGTQHVTVGGAVAADVHGKNHSTNGSFGNWIVGLTIITLLRGKLYCSENENSEIYHASIGGLGLTGLIELVEIKVERISSIKYQRKVNQFKTLDEMISDLILIPGDQKTGWFNAFNTNNYYTIEDEPIEVAVKSENYTLPKAKISIPFKSFAFVRPSIMKIYNKRYARKLVASNNTVVDFDEVHFPLDGIKNWNFLYGRKGFYQFQCAFPSSLASEKIQELLSLFDGQKALLIVLKKHGEIKSKGMLSFVEEGVSIALDFMYTKEIETKLKNANQFVADNGGRVYLVKDALLDDQSFAKMYDRTDQFKAVLSTLNDGKLKSRMATRLKLVK